MIQTKVRLRFLLDIFLLFFGLGQGLDDNFTIFDNNLIVAEDQTMTLFQNLQPLNRINLLGTLIIKPTEDIHMQYHQLLFGIEGVLIIYTSHSSHRFSIIFEKLTDYCNPENLNVGKVIIRTVEGEEEQVSNNIISILMEKSVTLGSQLIFHKDSLKFVSRNQRIRLYAFDRDREYIEEFLITNVKENEIFLDRTITLQYESYSNTTLLNPKLLLLEKSEQVTFKYACMKVISPHLNGIVFIDSIHLGLDSPKIQNCIFISSFGFKSKSITLEGSLNNNIFDGVDGNISVLQRYSQSFEDNIILNSHNFNITTHQPFSNNLMIDSEINLRLSQENTFIFNLTSKQTTLNINPSALQNILQIKYLQSFNSKILSTSHFTSFQFSETFSINTETILSQAEYISITNSYFYSETDILPFLIQSSNQLKKVNLTQSTFKGSCQVLMKGQKNIEEDSDQTEKLNTWIYLEGNHFMLNNNKNIYSLFNFYEKRFQYKSKTGRAYSQILVHNYNKLDPFLLLPNIISLPSNYEMSIYDPSDYRISNMHFISGEPGKIVIYQNNLFKEELRSSESTLLEIMSFSTQKLIFKSSNDVLTDVDSFLFEIFQLNQDNENKGRYTVIIAFSSRQLRLVEVSDEKSNQFKPFQLNNYPRELYSEAAIYLKQNLVLNQIEIQWLNLKRQYLQFTLKIELCGRSEVVEEGKCVETCQTNGKLSGFYCNVENKCLEGYFLDSDTNRCEKCSNGCRLCETRLTCTECFSGYMKDNNLCVDTCSRNQYYQNSQCYNCIENCLLCENQKSNPLYVENCSQCEFIEECLLAKTTCDKSCEGCIGESDIHCTSCLNNFSQKYGICLIPNEN